MTTTLVEGDETAVGARPGRPARDADADTETTDRPNRLRPARMLWLALTRVGVPLAIIALAVYITVQLLATAPEPARTDRARQAALVEIVPITLLPERVTIEAMGVVTAARSVEVKPQVPGRIEWVSPRLAPGAAFEAGEPIVRIERADFELAVRQRESEVRVAAAAVIEARRRMTLAETALRLEEGNQRVAQREFELLGEDVGDNRALVLREPQLAAARAEVDAAEAAIESAEAALEAARADLENARLDLTRTEVVAPFDAIVNQKIADLGDYVGTSTSLVHLLGTDTAWIELSVPERDLLWIDMPGPDGRGGSTVEIRNSAAWGDGRTRTGRVLRRFPTVDAAGRMAKLLVEVEDPFAVEADDTPPLLVGTYVRSQIEGVPPDRGVLIPRSWVRDGDVVWVMDAEDRLSIRRIQVGYRGSETVVVTDGLALGERVVVSALGIAIDGMPLRTGDQPAVEESGS